MEEKFIRPLIALGVPGVALGIFYMLLKKFNFQFSQVDSNWTVAIAFLFLIIIAGITFYALHKWAPTHKKETDEKKEKPFVYQAGEEKVTYTEKMTSLKFDVVKVNAHSHFLGIAAEYAWIDYKYPNSERICQSVTSIDALTGKGEYKSGQTHFDIVKFKLPDGREKEIYFDITSFFNGKTSSVASPDEFVSRKIAELYQN